MLITEGKTNWKYIIIIVILAAIVGGGILIFVKYQDINYPISTNELSDQELLKYAKSSFNKEKMMFKDIRIGYHNEIPVRVTFPCSDLCPDYTIRVIRYDVEIAECDNTEGVIKEIYVPFGIAVMPEKFCFPQVIVNNNIYEFVKEDEIVDWKTYRNEEYGFEVKYPEDWKNIFVSSESLGLEKDIIGFRPIEPEPGSKGYFYIGIGVKDNPQLLPLHEFYAQERKKWDGDYGFSYFFFNELTPTVITIAEREAFKFEKAPGMIPVTFIVVPRGNLIFEISKKEDLSYTDIYSSEELKDIFNQILSTFSFIEEGVESSKTECVNFDEFKEDISENYKIYLKSREFIPSEGLECSLLNKLGFFKNIHVIIQFHKIPLMEEKVELQQKEISLINYIPQKAYFSTVPSSENKLRDILNISYVRWIGDIFPEDKISEDIKKDRIGDWAIDEENNIILQVKFFEDVSPNSVKSIAQNHGKVKSEVELLNYITISVQKEKINELAKEDEVQWIGLISPPPIIF